MRLTRQGAGLAAGALMIAGLLAVGSTTAATAQDTRTPWTLAAVADACQRTAQGNRPGVAEIASRLQDADTKVTITVPCVVHLVGGASVSLSNVQITARTLNLHDRDTGAAPNAVAIARSTVTLTGERAGLLVELNDAKDTLNFASTTITAPAGVSVRVAGQRNGDNQGGTVQMAASTVVSDGAGTAGIQVLASDTSGTLNLAETVLDTPGPLTVMAGRCTAVRAGKTLNCSTDQVGRDLGN